jgi:hypothetical protein
MNVQIVNYKNSINNVIPVISVLIMTLFSHFVYPGYDVFIGDHKVYIPTILQKLNQGLFPDDIFLSVAQHSFSLFDELVVSIIKTSGASLFKVLFYISLTLRFIFLYTIYKLSMYIAKDKILSLCLVIFFCLALTKVGSLNHYVLSRSFGIVLGLLSFALYFGQRRISSSIVLSVCLLFHVPSFIPFASFFYLALFMDFKDKLIKYKSLLLGFIPLSGLMVLLSCSDMSGISMFSRISEQYYLFAMERIPDIFLMSRPGLSVIFVYLFNFLLFGFALYNIADQLERHHFRYLVLVILATFTLLIVTIIGVDIFRSVFVVQIQTMRAYQLIKIVAAIIFAYSAYIHLKNHPSDVILNLMFTGTIVSLIVLPNLALLFLLFAAVITLLRRWLPSFSKQIYGYSFLLCAATCMLILILALFISGSDYLAKKTMLIVAFVSLVVLVIKVTGFSMVIRPAVIILFLSSFVLMLMSAKGFSYQPKCFKDESFMELSEWIKTNTSVDDVFLTEPFINNGERISMICGRSIFPTFEMVGLGSFDEDLVTKAMKRYDLVKDYKRKLNKSGPGQAPTFFPESSKPVISMMRRMYLSKEKVADDSIREILLTSPETEKFIQNVKSRFKVDYVVSKTPMLLMYPIVFKNNEYLVYNLK